MVVANTYITNGYHGQYNGYWPRIDYWPPMLDDILYDQ